MTYHGCEPTLNPGMNCHLLVNRLPLADGAGTSTSNSHTKQQAFNLDGCNDTRWRSPRGCRVQRKSGLLCTVRQRLRHSQMESVRSCLLRAANDIASEGGLPIFEILGFCPVLVGGGATNLEHFTGQEPVDQGQ